jgi:hypothetical protein
MRHQAGGAFGLARILWKQVPWCSFSWLSVPNSLMRFPARKGLVWLLLATMAEVPPTVRLSILLHSFFLLIVI